MPKIVYVSSITFTRRDFIRYGFPFMLIEGYDVCLVDVAALVIPSIVQSRAEYENWEDVTSHIISTQKELRACQMTFAEADLIVDLVTSIGHTRYNLSILRAISKSRTPSLVLSVNALPGYTQSEIRSPDLLTWLKRFPIRFKQMDFINSLIVRLPRQIFGIKAANFIVYGGIKSYRKISTVDNTTKVIWAHAMDYDYYLEINTTPPPPTNTAVFIDQALTSHREFQTPGLNKSSFDADYYIKSLNQLFSQIEHQTGLKVIIAAHPNAMKNYDALTFKGREIVSGKSHELIAKSKLVIMHNSTIVNLAVSLMKPLFFIVSRDMTKRYAISFAENQQLCNSLSKEMIFLGENDDINIKNHTEVNVALYENYIENYVVTKNSPQIPLWEIIRNSVRESGVEI